MELETQIIALLNNICGTEDGELPTDFDLFEAGLLDSFGVIQLLMELEVVFGIALHIEDIPRDQISTPLKIAALVQKVRETP